MPSDMPPAGPPFPGNSAPDDPFSGNQDFDRTIAYRGPRAQPAPGADALRTQRMPEWDQPEVIGYGTVPGEPAPPPRRGSRGWIIAIVAAILVAVVGGGGVYAVSLLSGGGSQPQDVLPGNAIAYVRLDLDPSAGQKIALFQIARKFSVTKRSFTGDDPRQALFNLLRQNDGELSKVDYAKDVEPWLGDRIGVAVLAPAAKGEEPGVAVAVQVKDENAAREGLAKLAGGAKDIGVAFRDGYAIVAQAQNLADTYAKATPLTDTPAFADDVAALGEQGVLSFWTDLEKVGAAAGSTADADAAVLDAVRGVHVAGALRFDGSYAELAGLARGGSAASRAQPEPVKIGELPASTVGAVAVSGLGDVVSQQWPQIEKAASGVSGEGFTRFVQEARQRYGLSLPDDLVTFLGKGVSVALDEQGLSGEQPNVGAVLDTDPAKAGAVLDKVEKFLADSGTPMKFARANGDDRLVVASTQEYADTLTKAGTLGDGDTFRLAVPDAGDATYAAYADLDKVEKFYLSDVPESERADVQTLRAVGLSGRQSPDETTFSLRVVFN
ncbi:DUF3352 domain-containing protein [Microbispora sp. RL4-1S]|uniref:DUF3352 domain-containing protein n=1 Tax=Microbispora oryzae TaxID=2806554 RepID=A0A940WI09_9ACTN|nr:DUF3352 domain-containing protein [Microbispora oryzae]MBP2705248.1 DUF3352 domain-containing protein [Microbispora oryzae]